MFDVYLAFYVHPILSLPCILFTFCFTSILQFVYILFQVYCILFVINFKFVLHFVCILLHVCLNIVLQFVLDSGCIFQTSLLTSLSLFCLLKLFYKSNELGLECPIIVYCVWYCEVKPILMVAMEMSPNKKRVAPITIWGFFDIQQRMSGRCFERYVVNKCGSYDVPQNGYKYRHCDLTNREGYMIVTLTIGSYFTTSFSPYLNIGGFVCTSNFGVTFHNKFERGD